MSYLLWVSEFFQVEGGMSHSYTSKNVKITFGHLMSEGKVSMALRLLSTDSKGGVLFLDSMIPNKTTCHDPVLF